jgi:hypothetical protein
MLKATTLKCTECDRERHWIRPPRLRQAPAAACWGGHGMEVDRRNGGQSFTGSLHS